MLLLYPLEWRKVLNFNVLLTLIDFFILSIKSIALTFRGFLDKFLTNSILLAEIPNFNQSEDLDGSKGFKGSQHLEDKPSLPKNKPDTEPEEGKETPEEQSKKRSLNNEERKALVLPNFLTEVLIGLILGDLSGRITGAHATAARFIFKQGTVHLEYICHLYGLFYNFTPGVPTLHHYKDKRTNKVYSNITFGTYTSPCFLELHKLFYSDKIKFIPSIIGDLLTPVSLAYWICDDGSFNRVGRYVTLCTDSFTLAEVELLIKVLNTKFNLIAYKVKNNNNHRIVISTLSLSTLQDLILPHMPPMMLHKIGK